MSDLPEGVLPENMVLSNRDKSRHSDERGLDSKNVQTEQYQDHAGNRQVVAETDADTDGNTSGLANPKTDDPGRRAASRPSNTRRSPAHEQGGAPLSDLWRDKRKRDWPSRARR